jgi:hypothetical protein
MDVIVTVVESSAVWELTNPPGRSINIAARYPAAFAKHLDFPPPPAAPGSCHGELSRRAVAHMDAFNNGSRMGRILVARGLEIADVPYR